VVSLNRKRGAAERSAAPFFVWALLFVPQTPGAGIRPLGYAAISSGARSALRRPFGLAALPPLVLPPFVMLNLFQHLCAWTLKQVQGDEIRVREGMSCGELHGDRKGSLTLVTGGLYRSTG